MFRPFPGGKGFFFSGGFFEFAAFLLADFQTGEDKHNQEVGGHPDNQHIIHIVTVQQQPIKRGQIREERGQVKLLPGKPTDYWLLFLRLLQDEQLLQAPIANLR